MLVMNKNKTWYTIDGVKVSDWKRNFGGGLPEEIDFAVDEDDPKFDEIMGELPPGDAHE